MFTSSPASAKQVLPKPHVYAVQMWQVDVRVRIKRAATPSVCSFIKPCLVPRFPCGICLGITISIQQLKLRMPTNKLLLFRWGDEGAVV